MTPIRRVELARAIYVAGFGTVPRLVVEEGKPLVLELGTEEGVPVLLVRHRDAKTSQVETTNTIPLTSVDCIHWVDPHEANALQTGKPLSQHREEAVEQERLKKIANDRNQAIAEAHAEKQREAAEAQKAFIRSREEAARARKAAERAQAEESVANRKPPGSQPKGAKV